MLYVLLLMSWQLAQSVRNLRHCVTLSCFCCFGLSDQILGCLVRFILKRIVIMLNNWHS